MEGLRYSEKYNLINYSLSTNLFKQYDLKVHDVTPLRSVFLLHTDKGKKILKRIDYDKNRLEFIEEALEYILRSYDKVMSFYRNKNGDICTSWKEQCYCIIDVLEGRECEFSNPLELSIATQSLAKLHNSSLGFMDYCIGEGKEELITSNSELGRTIEDYKSRFKMIKELKDRVLKFKYKNEFDEVFINKVDENLSQMEKSIDILEHSAFYDLINNKDKVVICHNDLAHHNILIREGEAYFIDFDYSVIDLRVRDINNFINKSVKGFAFDFNRVKDIIYDYKRQGVLEKEEIEVLYGLLYFPEDFYSIVNNYYNKIKQWDEEVFLDRLEKKSEYFHDREELLKAFKNKIIDF
ncbi:CotS family spore coat protein [Clostridium sp. MSJ-4]|uniref:CotS family spore coat protein n=1 Tax=Clostridium simiarum TaxID=2841506 RepID=A0ABS6EVN9_9CLOT|nr:CotS family spore coat protein [Clostridium simiarum]MBU5590278.1 CotS family spore coat protein [Clostridium simiarum]